MARVLAVGDCHAPVMIEEYPNFLEKVAEKYKTNKTVMIGDVADNCAMSFHTKAAGLRDPLAEYQKACEQIAELTSRFPYAHWLLGNHDCLPQRQLEVVGVPESFLSKPGKIWKTGRWKIHERYSDLVIDGCIYRHGDKGRGGRMAALSAAKQEFSSLIQGHHHSQGGVEWFRNKRGTIFGCQTGCGVDHQAGAMSYGKRFAAKPVLGCAVIIDGEQAIFEPMRTKK